MASSRGARQFTVGGLGLAALLLAGAAEARASTQSTHLDVPNAAIPQQGVRTCKPNVPHVGRILDVDVGFALAHTSPSQLSIRVIHPDGAASVLLVDHRCSSGGGFEIRLDDEATNPIAAQNGECGPQLEGLFQPEESLTLFDGLDIHGIWTIEVSDTVAGTAGHLFSCDLTLTYELKAGLLQRCNVTDVAIPDLGLASSTISLGETLPIADLDVLVDLAHPVAGDLAVSLLAPDQSTEVDLLAIPGACEGFDLTLNDEAAQSLPASCSNGSTVTGSYQPLNPLAGFDAIVALGDWTLEVADQAGGDTGTLEDWCLRLDFGLFRDGFDEFGDTRFWSAAEF